MKKLIYILFFCFAFNAAKSQATVPNQTTPSGTFAGKWYKYAQYAEVDSGLLTVSRDTSGLKPRSPLLRYWANAAGDSTWWYWDMRSWNKFNDSRWLKSGNDIVNSNSGNVIVGTAAGGSYTEKVQDYGSLRVRTGTNQNFIVNGSTGVSYLTDAGSIANATFTMGAISFPFSNIGVKETATGSITNPSIGITRTASIDTGTTLVSISRITSTIAPAGGSSAVNNIGIFTTVNQTGGANGATSGLYISPTLTSAFAWNSIYVVRGKTFLGENYVNDASGDSAVSSNTAGRLQNKIIHDHITAGTNITVSGSGSTPDPYVITGTGGGGGSGINTVVGTANRITITGTTDLVVNVSPAYVGQSTITTLGTIVTGVWNGTAIGDTYISSAATWNAKESALTFSSPLSRSVNTISIPVATTSVNGYLSSTDWTTFNNKQATITGGATTITSSNLTASRALASDGSGKVAVVATTSTELGYLSGVTNNLQFAVLQATWQTITYGATSTMNCNNGFNGILTLTGNSTLAFSNFPAKGDITIKIIQDATGSRTITLPANSKVPLGFGSGTTITLTTTGAAYDLLFCKYDGTNYNWMIAKNLQ